MPDPIDRSLLWAQMHDHADLQNCLADLRTLAGHIGQEAARTVPGFTDHSLRHMDALWNVTESVLTEAEIRQMPPGEAFILGASYYVHDLGMAYAATEEGARRLRETSEYRANATRLARQSVIDESEVDRIALQETARQLHARKAHELVTEELPGLNQFLIEKASIREHWSAFIGDVAASHHWPIAIVEERLGQRNDVPDPLGRQVDLAYVACILRIVDYAHINFERASHLDRALRSEVPPESLVHWKAQEYIAGPVRRADRLVFSSIKPIDRVDPWWLFYHMASGLDSEIATVNDYLNQRLSSHNRFSLEGVKDVREPTTFARLVQPAGFEPVDVQFRPESMDRLVEILGGETLYGNDHRAPIRELLQNARDAVQLRIAEEAVRGRTGITGDIEVRLSSERDEHWISVADNGIGMNSRLITGYLLGIASNYWQSSDYMSEYPNVEEFGFSPIGQFGIGFLSVFMIGDHVTVESKRRTGQGLRLDLAGVGRRGALRKEELGWDHGTVVRVRLEKQSADSYANLARIVCARAPMLDFRMSVSASDESIVIEPGWWRTCSQGEIISLVEQWHEDALGVRRPKYTRYRHRGLTGLAERREPGPASYAKRMWGGNTPEVVGSRYRILAVPEAGDVILCNSGIAVDVVHIRGLMGLIDEPELSLTASRGEAIGGDLTEMEAQLKSELSPAIIEALDSLDAATNIPMRFRMLCSVAEHYGVELLQRTQLRWVTVIDPPGEARLVSAEELHRRADESSELAVTFGAGPWSAWNVLSATGLHGEREMLVVCVPSWSQPPFGEVREEEDFRSGTLSDHFESRYRTHGRSEGWQEAYLLVAVLQVVGKSYGRTADELAAEEWIRKRTDYLVMKVSRE